MRVVIVYFCSVINLFGCVSFCIKAVSRTCISLANRSLIWFDCFSNSVWNCFCSCSVFYLIFNSCSVIVIGAFSSFALLKNLAFSISCFCLDVDLPSVRLGLSSSSLKDLNRVLGFSASSLGLKTLPVFLCCYCLRAVIWAYCSRMFFSNY